MPVHASVIKPNAGLSSSLVSCFAAYDRKKYTWKLLYSHMMGFEVDFGHKEAADLIMSTRYDEKQVGYQALTILLNEARTIIPRSTSSVKCCHAVFVRLRIVWPHGLSHASH
jgi:hypothetical protein